MANTKSAEKRNRQAQKRRARNQAVKTQVRGSIKEVRDAIAKDPAKAAELVRDAERTLAKAAPVHPHRQHPEIDARDVAHVSHRHAHRPRRRSHTSRR